MRGAGVQIEALTEYVALFQQGESTSSARKQILIAQRDQLEQRIAEMKETLQRLNFKIEHYNQHVVSAQKKLKTPNK
jgi:DNA-binding transcriptional MerR regulator